MRKIEPLSLIVFIIGLVLAITGITLAIVFGVQGSKSCPSCQCTVVAANDCSAHLFTVRTGLKGQSWSQDLTDPATATFISLANTISVQMQASLQSSMTANSKSFVLAAANNNNNNNNVVVQVTKFILANDNVTVIAVASAGIAGPAPNIQSLSDTIDKSMQNTLAQDNYTDPVINNDSMTFCQNPYTNLSETTTNAPATVTPPVICTTAQPVEQVTCPTVPAPTECNCPAETTLSAPTDCPVQVCPSPSEPTMCSPCPSVPTETSTVPATVCPTIEPAVCPTSVKPAECNCNTDAPVTSPTSCPIPSCPSSPEPTQCNPCPTSFEQLTCPTQPVPTDCSCPSVPTEAAITAATVCPTPIEPLACPTQPEPTECNCPIISTMPTVTDCPTYPPATSVAPQQTSAQSVQTTFTQAIPCSTIIPAATSTVQQMATVTQQATTQQPSSTVQAASSTMSAGSTTGVPVSSSTTGQTNVATSTLQAQSSTVVSTQTSVTNTGTTVTQPASSTVTQPATATVTQPASSTVTQQATPTVTINTATVTQSSATVQSSTVSSSPASEQTSISSQASTATSGATLTTEAQDTSTGVPSSTLYSTSQAPTSCPGYSVYKGDIAIVYEQLSSKVVPSQATVAPVGSTTPEPPVHYIDIELFIASQLMGFGGNPYDLSGGNTRAMLAPYPKTERYSTVIQGNYAGSPKSVTQLNATMYQANVITVARPADFLDPVILDGLTAVQNANDHGTNYGVLVIIGFSADFAATAVPLATSLRSNYHVFTVSFDATQDFSSLASDSQSSFTLTKPSDSAAARSISMNIAQFAVSQSSECITTTVAVPTTTRKQTTNQPTTKTTNVDLTTSQPQTTTEYCPNKFINQDIAIVWEESKSTGSYAVSDNVNVFLQTLIPQIEQNLMDSTDANWSPITNLSLIEYPGPDSYGAAGSFGTITSLTLNGILSTIQILGAGNNNDNSDINSGLVSAQTAFGTLSSGRKQTIILIANVADGVGGATTTATTLKGNGVMIITVAAVKTPGATLPLHDLSSGSQYELNLDTTNTNGYNDFASQVVQLLTGISTECCLTPDCYKPTTPGSTTAILSTTLVTTPYQSTVTVIPTTTGISTTGAPTTSACNGQYAFNGDISIVYELTKDDIGNGKEAQIQSFITDRLLAYSGFQIDGITSRILLNPYGFTSNYYPQGSPVTYSVVTSIGSSKSFLSTYNGLCSDVFSCTSVVIKDGLDNTATATDHGPRTGAVIIIGYSNNDVVNAQPSAQSLKDAGYQVFTVSFDETQPLDPLATTGKNYAFTRKNIADEGNIAKSIGDYLISINSVCVPPLTTAVPTTTTTFTTTAPVTTTEYCPNKYINQDIAIVWEESSSTGSFDVSNNVNSFLQTLVPQIAANLVNSADLLWSSVTNMSLIEYPNPASYGPIGAFGTIKSDSLSGILGVIQALGFNPSYTNSDINSGLLAAQTAFATLSSGRKQTIILIANVGTGVGGATDTASQLKTNGITIVTVAAVTRPGDTIPLSDLSSGANFEFNLNTSNQQGYKAVGTQIVQALASISTQCCLTTDCSTSTDAPL